MRTWGITLGIIGGILSLIASVFMLYINGLSCAWNLNYGCSRGNDEINFCISFLVILLSLSNTTCYKFSSALIVIVSGIGFFAADGMVGQCLVLSFIGGLLAYISLIKDKNKNKNAQDLINHEINKHDNSSKKDAKKTYSRSILVFSFGLLSGLLGILTSMLLAHETSSNFETNFFISSVVTLFSLINLFSNKFASGVIIVLSCFGFMYADKMVGVCLMISLIVCVMTYIPWEIINKKKQCPAYNEINKHTKGTETTE